MLGERRGAFKKVKCITREMASTEFKFIVRGPPWDMN
jgi:hypothetical protein